jgi:tetratricopeptide (TPR) repeat protein
MTPPRVFISYSHDSPAHEAKVLALADRLRSNGIDAVLDQYESFPPRGWIQWMKDQVRDAQFVLVVCTEIYKRRWDGEEKAGVGLGATFEGQTLQQILYDAAGVNERLIPVLLEEGDRQHIPLELRKYSNFLIEGGYEALRRFVSGETRAPALPRREAKSDYLIRNVPQRNIFFTGREPELEAIRKALTERSAAALSGLGGMGKTQTAIEYAYVYRAEYRVVLWSVADSRDALLSGFAAFAQLLDLPEKVEKDLSVVAAAVRGWLESNSGWLLILDNVDSIEDLLMISQFAPNAGGHVLITTRLQATGGIAELVELNKMTPDEGARFLLRRAKQNTGHASAREISVEVDGLPLALDQAGAFIEETPSTFKEYLDLYRAEGAALRGRRGKLAPDHASVTITFSLAFAKLAEANPAAADVVRGCAFLAPDAIPEEVFTQAGAEWGEPIASVAARPRLWLEAIEEAGKFALIRRDAVNKSLYIHRLVQEVVKDQMDAETRRTWAERAVEALDGVFPGVEFQTWPQCERLSAHVKIAAYLVEGFGSASAEAARLFNESGLYLLERAQYHEAEPLLRRAITTYEKTLGPEHPSTALSLNNLAELYREQGRYAEAEPLHRRAIAIREGALGPGHPDVAQSLNNLALLYGRQGRYDEAEPLHRRALIIREEALGPEHPDSAGSLNNLAMLYGRQGRYGDAEPLCQRALAILDKTSGPGHPSTAISLNNLAWLYRNQGHYAEAEPLYRRALAILGNALGPEHPNTINAIRNYAELLRKLGRDAEADKLLARLS